MTVLPIAIGVLLALPACSGSSDDSRGNGGPTGAATEADVVASCDAICDRRTRCDLEEPEDPPCQPDCLRESADPRFMRGDVLRGLSDCYSELACGESDDRCLDRVVTVLVPDFMSSPLLDQCVEVQDQCGGFSDDSCAYAIIFTDAGKARLQDCLNETCELVAGCIAGLVQGS
jgi:hypothetical protein